MNLFDVVIISMAVYRLTYFIVYENAPFDMMDKLRTRLGVYDIGDTGPLKSFWRGLLSCPHCLSLWLAIIFGAAYLHNEKVIEYLFPLAIAGIVSLLFILTIEEE